MNLALFCQAVRIISRFIIIQLYSDIDMVQKLKIAAAGLGRMGARHAINFLHRTPRAELVAAFTPDPKELAWARVNLEPHGVKLYTDYDEMIKQEGLQAVVIGTATSVHAEEAIKAMHQGLHVLCEKPLSTSIAVVSLLKQIATAQN
jgi:predicted dehydrogenase